MGEIAGTKTPKLGFGFMRLPKFADGTYDMEQIRQMVDVFMRAGLTYYDTAYVYDNGGSEKALKEALVDRYPRESYTLATKLNVGTAACTDEQFAKGELMTSLQRLGTDYVDYYLLHCVQAGTIEKFNRFHLWEYVREQKAAGRIRHYGFSFHDTPELLDELLTLHPDAEFVQLQLNYADWEAPNVQSRGVYEVARRHGKPVVVMEPVKGGLLANPPEDVRRLFKKAEPTSSPASWAIRYVASLEGVLTVLSGMSSLGQVEDNVSYMKDFRGLNEEQQRVIRQAQAVLEAQESIPCTGCRYCVDGCPMSIPIPEIFNACNREMIYGDRAGAQQFYEQETRDKGKASDCISCLQCEGACPQHLPVTRLLGKAAERFE